MAVKNAVLDHDVLHQLLSFLSPHDLLQCILVSRDFYDVSSKDCLWEEFVQRTCGVALELPKPVKRALMTIKPLQRLSGLSRTPAFLNASRDDKKYFEMGVLIYRGRYWEEIMFSSADEAELRAAMTTPPEDDEFHEVYLIVTKFLSGGRFEGFQLYPTFFPEHIAAATPSSVIRIEGTMTKLGNLCSQITFSEISFERSNEEVIIGQPPVAFQQVVATSARWYFEERMRFSWRLESKQISVDEPRGAVGSFGDHEFALQ